MTGIEIVLPNGTTRQIVRGSINPHVVPVHQREGPPMLVFWGGFIHHEKVKHQLQAKPALIEIIAWSMGSMNYGWQYAQKNQFLQGCLLRRFEPPELIVYGVTFGRKPRILTLPDKERVWEVWSLPDPGN